MNNNQYRVAILIASDKGAAGARVDESGPAIRAILEDAGFTVAEYKMLSDDIEPLKQQLLAWSESGNIDLILTSGGTGFSPRDWMPEATLAIADRIVPGIPEAMRAYSMQITPRGMLSRAAAAICRQTLIINLPGSPKAVKETLGYILPALTHALEMLTGRGKECASRIDIE